METLLNNLDRSIDCDNRHYASNDSGLSSNSNGPPEPIDHKPNSFFDMDCDDLTKSLFINSIGGSELIHDDDIYSYKCKLEIEKMSINKFRPMSLTKTDGANWRLKNSMSSSSSLSSIIHDLENLKQSEPLSHKYPPIDIALSNGSSNHGNISDKSTKSATINLSSCSSGTSNSPTMKSNEDYLFECLDGNKTRVKPIRKPKPINSNSNIQEYVSSSVKNYKGDKSVNDLVEFIQGTRGSIIKPASTNKPKSTTIGKIESKSPLSHSHSSPPPPIIITESTELTTTNATAIENRVANVDVDSGTQSHFVSLNNSDEDVQISVPVNEFQEVLSKNRKKQKKPIINSVVTVINSNNNATTTASNTNNNGQKFPSPNKTSSKSIKKSNNKQRSNRHQNRDRAPPHSTITSLSSSSITKSSCLDLLDSKDSLQKFLSEQFSSFMKLSILVS